MDVDEAVALCGDRSKWHMLIFLLGGMTTAFPSCWQMLAIVFVGGVPRDFHCQVPDDIINDTIPFVKDQRTGEPKRDQCNQFVNESSNGNISYSTNATIPCTDGYTYHTDFTSTIVMEWELVCTRDYLKDLSQTIFVLGVMAGAIIFTTLADMFGRKPVFLGVNWCLLVVGTATAFAKDYYLFLFLRFIAGALQQGITLSGFVLCVEIFAANQRTFAGIIVQVFWGGSMVIQAGIAYALRDWRDFQLAITLPMIITLGGWWVCPESMSWQAANQKEKEAEKQLRKIARFNGVKDYPEHPLTENSIGLNIDPRLLSLGKVDEETGDTAVVADESKTEEKPKEKQSFKDRLLRRKPKDDKPKAEKDTLLTVIRFPQLRMNLLVMGALWFVNSLVYFGMSLSTGDLAGSRYVNFAIGGVVEAFAYTTCYFVIKRFGRRKPLCAYHVLAGICLAISVFIPPKAGGVDLAPVSTAFNMLGRFCISNSFAIIFLYAGELFPVNIRSTCIGVCSVCARIGGMVAPFSSLLVKKVYWLPGCIFAALSVVVGVLTLLLPETQGRALPQSVEEMKTWNRRRGRAKSFDVHASMRNTRRERRRSSAVRGSDMPRKE
ncbi:organic cation transporter protein-like [Lineus longissimus]|uniref:organic cation transporter protein-like n=1 Tax=Lineus longissimus TaxID=88925 RepID=UPI002B4F9473